MKVNIHLARRIIGLWEERKGEGRGGEDERTGGCEIEIAVACDRVITCANMQT